MKYTLVLSRKNTKHFFVQNWQCILYIDDCSILVFWMVDVWNSLVHLVNRIPRWPVLSSAFYEGGWGFDRTHIVFSVHSQSILPLSQAFTVFYHIHVPTTQAFLWWDERRGNQPQLCRSTSDSCGSKIYRRRRCVSWSWEFKLFLHHRCRGGY